MTALSTRLEHVVECLNHTNQPCDKCKHGDELTAIVAGVAALEAAKLPLTVAEEIAKLVRKHTPPDPCAFLNPFSGMGCFLPESSDRHKVIEGGVLYHKYKAPFVYPNPNPKPKPAFTDKTAADQCDYHPGGCPKIRCPIGHPKTYVYTGYGFVLNPIGRWKKTSPTDYLHDTGQTYSTAPKTCKYTLSNLTLCGEAKTAWRHRQSVVESECDAFHVYRDKPFHGPTEEECALAMAQIPSYKMDWTPKKRGWFSRLLGV